MDGNKMLDCKLKPIQISIDDIFKDVIYVVPIYQRNYAWNAKQIEQLIDDINSAENNYYLGTLITNQKEPSVYEIIDGQQRLTTLYLLKLYLSNNLNQKDLCKGEPLQFEARKKYRNTLICLKNSSVINDEIIVPELYDGYIAIKKYFENNSNILNLNKFREKLKRVYLIRIQVPKNIDLNHYFEIMNTRGEQLELHQIVKAKILEKLEKPEDKEIASKIWDCCANMDSYIQMNFNTRIRNSLFSSSWTDLQEEIIDNWDNLVQAFTHQNKEKSFDKCSLKEILTEVNIENIKNLDDEDYNDNERFKSTISFPNFILQVNAAINNDEKNDYSLDDKYFIEILKNNWADEKTSKNFILKMLQCRTLFDKYIIKREYAKDYQKIGKWSLQKLEKYTNKNGNDNAKPIYKSTYSKSDKEEEDNITQKLRTLESALRITYTSPKTMHWITIVLKNLLEDKNTDLIPVLEQYCLGKISDSNYKNKSGFDIERIVFSYLDYLLYRDNYNNIVEKDWEFQFRNSIEHFYPQHPDNGEYWGLNELNDFGNLALITVSGNSKFSNMPPSAKSDYKEIINQSIKLRIMSIIVNNNDKIWTKELAEKHKQEMINILDNNGIK